MSIISSQIVSVSSLLQINLSIPPYQRPYKWTVKNVRQLIDDISRFKIQRAYRIGTIIVYKEKDKEIYEIVDGQQRTITLWLIIRAIEFTRLDLSDNLAQKIASIRAKIFQPRFNSETSQQHIRENYVEIVKKVRMLDEECILFLLEECEVNYLIIDDISEAFQFFDSQNSRGKDLEPHDLLKAYHLRELSEIDSKNLQNDISKLVQDWESIESKQLANFFSNFLYRVRGWSKGDSARNFTKSDIAMFKGINLKKIDYPHTKMYHLVNEYLEKCKPSNPNIAFPFQLDQTIINGKYFFEMIDYYYKKRIEFAGFAETLTGEAREILYILNTYRGKDRKGDKYVRMLFDCALLYYVDKFGMDNLETAISKIFIWAYTPRLTYRSVQFASIDNYATGKINLFKIIREAVSEENIMEISLPTITAPNRSTETEQIKQLFEKMNYYYAN
jgi:uncharacterized protein with ParB-like and HNH nuclease domain